MTTSSKSRIRVVVGIVAVAAASTAVPADTVASTPPPAASVSWQSAGDSYSSGEGVYGNVGACAQSQQAYGPYAAQMLRTIGWTMDSETFTACTGHLVEDYFAGRPGTGSLWQWGRDQGGPDRVDVITMSFGGNDVGFADVIKDCLRGAPDGWSNPFSGCGPGTADLEWRADRLVDPTRRDCNGSRRDGTDQLDCELNLGPRRGSIVDFYYDVVTRHLTDQGRLYVVGYPAVFAPTSEWGRWRITCAGVTRGDADRLGAAARHLNDKLTEAVERVNQVFDSDRVVFIDRYQMYRDGSHELCGTGADWLNGVSTTRGYGFSYRIETSFHPNLEGHAHTARQLADTVLATFPQPGPQQVGYPPAECIASELLYIGMSGKREEVSLYQRTLAALGYDPGDFDGLFGGQTLNAAVQEIIDNSPHEDIYVERWPDGGEILRPAFERLGIACPTTSSTAPCVNRSEALMILEWNEVPVDSIEEVWCRGPFAEAVAVSGADTFGAAFEYIAGRWNYLASSYDAESICELLQDHDPNWDC